MGEPSREASEALQIANDALRAAEVTAAMIASHLKQCEERAEAQSKAGDRTFSAISALQTSVTEGNRRVHTRIDRQVYGLIAVLLSVLGTVLWAFLQGRFP